MTKTELADLEVAIGLITDLRIEMQKQFKDIGNTLVDVQAGQAAHLAVHDERDKRSVDRGVSRRWVIGVVATASLTIIGFVLGGIYHVLGI